VPHRGKRNEPAFVTLTIERLAVVRETAPMFIADRTAENARRLFALAMPDPSS
jgi:TatD DNase family protein